MSDLRTVVRDEVVRTRVVVTVGPVDRDPLGTFGWFIGVRCRHAPAAREARDRGRYGTCAICRRKLDDDEQVHMVFDVVRNSRTVGNRLCCAPCVEKHGTFNTRKATNEAVAPGVVPDE